jgi:amino acid permease
MPLNFVNGGWLFSAICIVLSMFWTLYCAKLLIETHKQVGGGSFPEIG